MLSENPCGSPARACLAALVVLAQRGEPTPAIPTPMVFLPQMHRSFRQQGPMSHEPSSTRLFGPIDSTPRRTRPEPRLPMTSPDRAQHEPAPSVPSNGTESDGEARTCP